MEKTVESGRETLSLRFGGTVAGTDYTVSYI